MVSFYLKLWLPQNCGCSFLWNACTKPKVYNLFMTRTEAHSKLVSLGPRGGLTSAWLAVESLVSSDFQSQQCCGTADGRSLCKPSQHWDEFLLEPDSFSISAGAWFNFCWSLIFWFIFHFTKVAILIWQVIKSLLQNSILNSSLFTISGGLS